MRTCSLWSSRLVAVAMTASLRAQVSERRPVVATDVSLAHPGQAGVEWFAQGFTLGSSGVGGSDLLRLTIR